MRYFIGLSIWFTWISVGCKSASQSGIRDFEVTKAIRDELVLSAKVFQGIEKPSEKTEVEVKNGPFPKGAIAGQNYFDWGKEVTCVFSLENLTNPPWGLSPKFLCDILDENGQVVSQKVKIKYDKANPEVYNEAAGSRLLWLLGFPADYYYPIKVRCIGCPSSGDIWQFIKDYKTATADVKAKMGAEVDQRLSSKLARSIEPALIEKQWGSPIELEGTWDSGWSFMDDLAVDPERLLIPKEQRAEEMAKRHALTILAGMLSHVDNQAGNQSIDCQLSSGTTCPKDKVWLVVADLGATMGGFRLSWDVRNSVTDSAQLALAMTTWRSDTATAVFSGASSCKVSVASLAPNQTLGPIKQTQVSEAGRQFLLKRFYALGGGTEWSAVVEKNLRRQLRFVFLAGRNGELYQNVDWWVDTLVNKLNLVRNYKGCA